MDITWIILLTGGFTFNFENFKVSGNRCKTQEFRETFENKALKDHVVKTEWASSEGHCESKCFIDDRCISYNFGIDAKRNGRITCELSDSDHVMHPSDLIGREKTVYRRAKNNCKCPPYKVCKVNWLDETHQCECKSGFSGALCNITVASPTNSGSSSSYKVLEPGRGQGWYGAKSHCVSKGGDLPSIHSAADNEKVKSYYRLVENPMWLGIKKDTNKYTWTNGKPVDFTNWKSSPGTGNCGYMDETGKWGLANCGVSKRFICFS